MPTNLDRVARALGRIDLSLLDPETEELRRATVRTIEEYVEPRLAEPDGPIVVAVVGVSGTGKSTLINSLAGRRITGAGATRPTTTEPIAWADEELPATLGGARARLPGRIVEFSGSLPAGVVLLDTPPPGVVDGQGVPVVHQVLEVADACVLVASSARYGDAAGLDLARRAAERSLPAVVVLNRLPDDPGEGATILGDYAGVLGQTGLVDRSSTRSVVTVGEARVEGGVLPPDRVSALRREIESLVAAPREVVDRVVGRSLDRVGSALPVIRAALIEHEVRRVTLLDPVRLAYGAAAEALVEELRRGRYAASATDPARLAEALATAAARHAGRAALRSAEAWQTAVPDLVARHPDLFTHGSDTVAVARERVEWWATEWPTEFGPRFGRKRAGARLRRLLPSLAADSGFEPARGDRRFLRRHPGLAEAARGRLEGELAAVVEADGHRFATAVGGGPPPRILADLRLEEEPS